MEKMDRRELRVKIIEALYSYDIMDEFIFMKEEDNDPYVVQVVNYFVTNKNEIDELISSSLTNYKLNRLSFVDRAIIRMATTEMKFGLAKAVAINEALEIAKQYTDTGDGASVRFDNKVLDTISKKI